MTLDTVLGAAYRSCMLDNARGKAVADLRLVFEDHPDLKAEAEAFLADKTSKQGKEIAQRCFITKTRTDLILAALADN